MGNRKALLVSLASSLLLGIYLVPAFAEDAAISNQNENPSIAVEQLNVSDGISSTDLVTDEESDAATSGSAGATTPEKLKSVYDLASEHVDDLADGLYTLGSSVNGKFVLDVPGGTASAGKKLQLYGVNNTDAQVWRVSHARTASLSFRLSRAVRWMLRAEVPVTEILFSSGLITELLRSVGLQLRKPTAALH